MLPSGRSWFVLCVALAACGDERTESSGPSVAPTPSAVAPPAAKPAPPPAKPVDLSFGTGYELRRPLHDGRLTIVPIVQTAARSTALPHYVTLQSAMNRHIVTVRELGDWQVDTVRIKNKSREPVFAMAGEVIVDALQDRVIARDVVIPPHTSIQVAVRCVEQNREQGGRTFHAGNALAELDLREPIVHQAQTQVWAQVDTINQRLGLSPPTKTYRIAAQAQPTARAAQIQQQLAALPDRANLVGLAVAIDGKVVAIDRFASPQLYQDMESELLGSYAASDDGPPHEGNHTLSPDDVRALAGNQQQATTTDASFVAIQAL